MYIELIDTNGRYTISTDEEYVQLGDIVEFLIKPILRAASFSDVLIDKFFVKEEESLFDKWDREQLELDFSLTEEKVAAKRA